MALRPSGHVCRTNRQSLNLPLSQPRRGGHERDQQTREAAGAPVA
jgi:hypothetical protein